jgi:glycosyltransferase involved in cell wall biosynthesis
MYNTGTVSFKEKYNDVLMSSSERFFSVVIPLFNKELYIEKTIESLLNQTFKQFEAIIVNDGSTDNSLKLAQSLAAKDNRIKVFNKKHGGVSSARNLGISKARHEYIAFLDADDLWEGNYLEEMNCLISKYPDCGMYGCAYKAVRRYKVTYSCQNIPEGIVEDYFKVSLKDKVSWTSAVIVKKDVFEKIGTFPNGMIGGEDCFMWSKVATAYPMAFTPKVLSTYNMFLSGVSNRIGNKDSCTESWFELYKSDDFYRNEFIARKAIENGIRHAWGKHKSKSREIEDQFRYTTLFKHKWFKLYLLNRVPKPLISLLWIFKKFQTYYYVNFSNKVE